jgi:excisionase family DNA binding protein
MHQSPSRGEQGGAVTTLAPRLRLLTLKEAAEVLRVSIKTLQRRISAGQLSAIRDGRMLRITLSEIERYIAERRTA